MTTAKGSTERVRNVCLMTILAVSRLTVVINAASGNSDILKEMKSFEYFWKVFTVLLENEVRTRLLC